MNVSLNVSSWKRKALVPALAALTLLGAGCSQQKVPPRQQEADKQALAADSLHMARLHAQWMRSPRALATAGAAGREMPIDLSDEVQFRFVKNRLLASGSTPENSPRLFQQLERLRKEKTKTLPRISAPKAALSVDGSGGRARCGQVLSLEPVESLDAKVARFQSSGLVTCSGGADYAYADVSAFTTDLERTSFQLLGSQSFEDFAGTVLETPPLDLGVRDGAGDFLVLDSLAIAVDEETHSSHVSYSVAESSLTAMGAQNRFESWHPREITGHQYTSYLDNPIRVCLERGGVEGYLDCDYASGNWDPVAKVFQPFVKPHNAIAAMDPEASKNAGDVWVAHKTDVWMSQGSYDESHLYAPVSGLFQTWLGSDCTLKKVRGEGFLILEEEGGLCAAGTTHGTEVSRGGIPFGTPAREPYNVTVPFEGLVDFGPDCLRQGQDVRLLLGASLEASCPMNIAQAGFRPHRNYTTTWERAPIDFRNECLAEGTQVVKADGTKVPVEAVKVGDRLLANGNGLALTVTTVSRGGESKPMVKLRDTTGGEVMMTETHPLVTATRGVVQAGELKVGDAVVARDGVRKLAAVERVPYDGRVYNFALGTPEELAAVGPEARTLYANGFLVGDSYMQSALEKARKLDAREVLSRLHGSWHEDYRQHQSRLKSARR